jgi:hypothetical protein
MAARHRGAKRLFELGATRADQSLGTRVKDVFTVGRLQGEQRAWFAQSFSDGDCEYTLELTAVRP